MQNRSEQHLAPKLLYFITEDWFFCSHFIDRAIAARQQGFEVAVATRVNRHAQIIEEQGIRVIPLVLERTGLNPMGELRLLKDLIALYRAERPHIVHHIAVKPILYGTIAAKLAQPMAIVNAPVGMGYVFSSKQLKARLLRPFIMAAYRLLMNPRNGVTIFENPDDVSFFARLGIVNTARTKLIRGAGVDMEKFAPSPLPAQPPLILFAARLLWDKGVGEFVQAARTLRGQGLTARFVIAGAPDSENPGAVSQTQLEQWREEGVIEWWGYQSDMPAVMKQCHIFCLPTAYAEGLPKVLIEAAAAGRAIVTTDAPGCREMVKHDENGLLVPTRDVDALVSALRKLIDNPALQRRMGEAGRTMAVQGFSMEQVNGETIALYRGLLAGNCAT